MVAQRLQTTYGTTRWQGGRDGLSELISTVLSQHTSDSNTARAFTNLRSAFPAWADVEAAPTTAVADAIRTGGLANIKAQRIQRILADVRTDFGAYDLSALTALPIGAARSRLVALPGVGPKTASCVLLFAFGMPTMPVDTHVHRVALRLGLVPPGASPTQTQDALEASIGPDRDAVYRFHLNAIKHGRTICIARRPRCERCALSDICDFFAEHRAAPTTDRLDGRAGSGNRDSATTSEREPTRSKGERSR